MVDLLQQSQLVQLMLVGSVLLSWVALAFALISLSRIKRQELSVAQGLSELQESLKINNSGLVGMGRKLLLIEKNIAPSIQNSSAKSFQQIGARKLAAVGAKQSDLSVANAIALLKQGMSPAQVVSATGLSSAEVNLMAMLNRPLERAS